MPHIVIAGSGPVGLSAAIFIKQKYGPNVDVTVLDHHIDNYDRPGLIAFSAVETIRSMGITPLHVETQGSPPAISIRELQKDLVAHARRLGINLEKTKYCSIAGQTIVTDPAVADLNPNCDLLIDCTGERRTIMSAFKAPTKPLGNNPIPNHFVAYINMDQDNAEKMFIMDDEHITPAALKEFKERTGWSEFVPPWMDTLRKWTHHDASGHPISSKYCLYFEVPAHIAEDPDLYEPYVQALLKLKTGQDITFTKSKERGGFGPFEVKPKLVETPIITNSDVTIVALGDSMMSAEFHLGTGVMNGVSCAYKLVDSLNIDEKIHIDQEKWHRTTIDRGPHQHLNVDAIIATHEKKIKALYATRRHAIAVGTNSSFDQHMRLTDEQIDPPYLLEMAQKLHAIAQDTEMTQPNRDAAHIRSLHAFQRWYSITKDPSVVALLSSNGKSSSTKEHKLHLYQCAFDIARDAWPNDHWAEKIKLQTNIGVQYYNSKQYPTALTHFEQAKVVADIYGSPESQADLSKKMEDTGNAIAKPVPAAVTTEKRAKMQAGRKKEEKQATETLKIHSASSSNPNPDSGI